MLDRGVASARLAADERTTDAVIAGTREQGTLDEVIQLRRQRNDIIPSISCLPSEIIAEILVLFVHHARQTHSYYHRRLRWIRITHVCARWRDIARSLPNLWATIYNIRDLMYTDTFLALSQDLPLSIVSDDSYNVDTKFFVPLSHAMARIQHMKLSLRWSSMVGLIVLRRYSQDAVVPKSAPSLETLDLTYTPTQLYSQYHRRLISNDPGAPQSLWFFSPTTPMPKLRTLSLSGLPLSFTKDLSRPTLTELRVSATAPFTLTVWQNVLATLPLLEVLHITGAREEEDDTPITPSELASSPDPSIELCQLRELCLSRGRLTSDQTGVCTRLLQQLIIPSSCKIDVSIAKHDPLSTIDAVMSKKDGRAYLGEPQELTSLCFDSLHLFLWPEERPLCTSPEETCAVQFHAGGAELFYAIQLAPKHLLNNIQLLCIQEDHVKLPLLTLFPQLCNLHVHGIERLDDQLNELARLPPATLPRLRSLSLQWMRWRTRGDKKPLSLVIDAILTARREAGAAIEELYLHQLYSLDDQED
ncbi:hypothetical protein PHLGIDRAFT_129729, partial [Phlebiopsis gigantea 11061_1 CR5-6]